VEEEVVSVLAGVKDIADLSLEDLLNAELTTSTKSKPMSIRDSPNVMTLVTREEIQRSGARELADVLLLVPGFTLNGDLYSSVYAGIRGVWGSEGKILVLLDGHEMFDLLYYDTELGNRVPVDQIDRIEIVRGPGSVIYGGAAELAVINIITRSAKDLEGGSVTAIYGQMFDGAARKGQSLSQTFGHRTLSAAFGKTIGGQRGLSLKAGIYVGQGNRSDQTYTDINGASYNVAGNARSDPMLLHAAAEYRGLKLGYLFEYYRTNMKDGYGEMLADTLPVNYLSSSLNVSYEWTLRQNLKLVPRFHWLFQKPWQTASEAARGYPSIYWDPTAQRVQGGLTLVWNVVRPLNLLFGNDYYVDSATNTYDPFVDPSNPALTTSHVSYWNATVYGEALLDTPWANLSAGARYEHRRLVGGSFVPRAGATKIFGPFHYKLLYGRAFRAPSMGDLAKSIDVKPETTTVAEVELGYRIHPTLFAVVNGFDITIDKPFLYFFDNTTGLDSYRNYDRMGTRGAEFELRFRSERTFANLSYSYYTAAGKDKIDPMAVAGHGSVLLGFSPHKVALLAGAGITKQLDASLSAILLAGPRFGYYAYDASSGAPLARDYGAEMQLNAFLSYKDLLVPGSLVGIGIYNLANAKTVLIQPYDNGHPPFPGPSREVFLRLGYEVRRQANGPSAP
jgi:outer membrane receptor protein involved in Fe transport